MLPPGPSSTRPSGLAATLPRSLRRARTLAPSDVTTARALAMAEIDREIARLKLATMGVEIDRLSEEQERYLASWDEGT